MKHKVLLACALATLIGCNGGNGNNESTQKEKTETETTTTVEEKAETAEPKEKKKNFKIYTAKTIQKVKDGDSFVFTDEDGNPHFVHLNGIDAPEKEMKYGTRARRALEEILNNGEVIVKAEEQKERSMFAEVYVDGEDAGMEMVEKGMAWRNTEEDTDNKYGEAEARAKNARLGLWSDDNPTPPWEHRAKKKEKRRGREK